MDLANVAVIENHLRAFHRKSSTIAVQCAG